MKPKLLRWSPLIAMLIILGLAAWLRFYKLSDWFYFMIDEERDAFIMRRIIVEHRPVLIGGSIPGGLYIGPAFYYISALIMSISKLNPLGEAVAASLLGIISVWLVYQVGRKLFSVTVGLFSSFFYAVSYLIVIYNRIYWPLVAAPVIALISYYCLIQLGQKKWRFVYPLTLAAIIGAQSDPSNFSTLLLIIFFWISHRLPFNRPAKLGLLWFFLAHIPLVLFDLRHNFLNTRALINFFSFAKHSSASFNPLSSLAAIKVAIFSFTRSIAISGPLNVSRQINPCSQYLSQRNAIILPALGIACLALGFFIFYWIRYRRQHPLGFYIIISHLLIALIGVIVYGLFFPGYINEWFFYVLFPAFSFIIGFGLSQLWRINPLATLFALAAFILVNLHSFFNTSADFGFEQKSQTVKFAIQQVGDQPFYLDSIGDCHSYEGSRYLFWLYGREPTASYMDPVYGNWLYPQPSVTQSDLSTQVILVSRADQASPGFMAKYQAYLNLNPVSRQFGAVQVLIVTPK